MSWGNERGKEKGTEGEEKIRKKKHTSDMLKKLDNLLSREQP